MARAPRGLGEAGREFWRDAIASAPWLSTAADLGLLRVGADLVDERAALRASIAEHGRLTTGSRGQPMSRPEVDQLRAVEGSLMKVAAALGLGAANRARLGARLELERRVQPQRPELALVAKYAEDLA